MVREHDADDQEETALKAAEEEKARQAAEAEKAKFFMEHKDGQIGPNSFDPVRKFGVIEAENKLFYDNITHSYPLNLPSDYYLKFI